MVNKDLKKACKDYDKNVDVAAAITDLNGNLVAAYGTDKGKDAENLATALNQPCSSLKPLSVYAPAIDDGTINWSSRYEDSPYKYVKNLEGVMRPWPSNSSEVYSERYAYIYQAIMESMNTVAVKCLKDYGIEKSISFLEKSFNMRVGPEKTTAKTLGAEEVIGNIALGFLTDGASVVDMAGYYQVFANGGKYEAPLAVLKLCDSSGKTIYERKYSPNQVIKNTTADIMNKMLKEVVNEGGTGEDAKCQSVEVAGKTGTDDNFKNNWFVGVTPEYSCAFWHGLSDKNLAAKIFSSAVDKIYSSKKDYKKNFAFHSNLKKVAYCTESGKQLNPNCTIIRTGYYTFDNVPGLCDRH